jgi:hypothetical protein
MKYLNRFILLTVISAIACYANGQGCSDAGFCTINTLKPQGMETPGTHSYNQVKFGLSNGKADHNISIWSAFLEYSRQINDKLGMDVKLTFLRQHSSLATSAGLSDIFVTANHSGIKNILLTAGIKVPLTNGDRKKNGLPLPMDFQTSLGTTDLILGIGYTIRKIELALALQQPLSQNKNSFLSTSYPMESPFSGFQSTNKYIRKGDLLLRVSWPVTLGEKWILIPGILPIYHLSDDEFTGAGGAKNKITGSKGLTFNANLFLEYALNKYSFIELSIGAPLIARDVRPDGLTRKYVVALEYKCRF